MRSVDRLSPNHEPRPRPPSLVVLHYTGMQDTETALARLTDPAPIAGRYPGPWQAPDIDPKTPLSRVSAHYVVGEDGTVYRVVPETACAWHAGLSRWAGEAGVNARSIGIEIVNGGHDFGLPPYPLAQIEAVIALVRDILARHGLGPAAVVGHSDIAPARKADPGEHFPWATLAAAGCARGWQMAPSLRGAPLEGSAEALRPALTALGYDDEAAAEAVWTAFQRRYRPALIDGRPDAECARVLSSIR